MCLTQLQVTSRANRSCHIDLRWRLCDGPRLEPAQGPEQSLARFKCRMTHSYSTLPKKYRSWSVQRPPRFRKGHHRAVSGGRSRERSLCLASLAHHCRVAHVSPVQLLPTRHVFGIVRRARISAKIGSVCKPCSYPLLGAMPCRLPERVC
jgi:hypothetical protein